MLLNALIVYRTIFVMLIWHERRYQYFELPDVKDGILLQVEGELENRE